MADVYDALTMKRVYKAAMAHEVARGIILEAEGKQFDPMVIGHSDRRKPQFLEIKESYKEG